MRANHHIIYNSRTGTEGSFCPPGCAYLCCASQGTPCINSTGLIPPSEHECNALFHSFSYSQSTCFTAFSCPGHVVLATRGQIHESYASLFHLRTCLPQFLAFLWTAKAFRAQVLKKFSCRPIDTHGMVLLLLSQWWLQPVCPARLVKKLHNFFTETEGDKREIKPEQVHGHINLPLVLKIAYSHKLCLDSVYIHKQGSYTIR